MPIVDVVFDKIEVERKKEIKPSIKLNISLTFKDLIEEKEIEDKKFISFVFDFLIDYDKEAKVFLEGRTIYVDKKEEIEKLIKNWRKDKEFMKKIYNFTLTKCNLKALFIEDQVNLPLHIPFPSIK
ncbi:MAG: hypothetical protein QXO12_00920 [Candidatus Pacearchaeota archaeon]